MNLKGEKAIVLTYFDSRGCSEMLVSASRLLSSIHKEIVLKRKGAASAEKVWLIRRMLGRSYLGRF